MFSMISEMARDGVTGFLITCLMVFLCLILAVFLFLLGYEIINNVNMPDQTGEAIIVGKEIIPEHTSVVMQAMTVGTTTTLIPITTYHPIQYSIKLQKGSEASSVNVAPSLYNELEVGSEVKVQYHTGRLDKAFHAQSLL